MAEPRRGEDGTAAARTGGGPALALSAGRVVAPGFRLIDCGVLSSALHSLAVLASGQGSNFEALVMAARSGAIPAQVVLLLCDRPEAPVLERARRLGIEAACPPAGRYRTRLEDESPWIELLRSRRVDLVLLAGFMRRLHAPFLDAYRDRILNIHPALLPAFPGLDPIGRALAHGVRVTGCTVHLVDEHLDGGPILGQRAVEIRETDTRASVEARMHEAEHRLYPETVRRYLAEPWRRDGRRIVFGDAALDPVHG
jgi:phosphoribosylglycinamide formyltransferase-1